MIAHLVKLQQAPDLVDRVYRALLAHPLIGRHDTADALTDKLLAAGAQHLAWAR